MNFLLIAMYSVIIVSTATFFSLIIGYLNNKPFGRQFISDKLTIGMASAIFLSITILSSAIITREVIGPFNDFMAWSTIVQQQFFQLLFGWSFLSFQVAHFCNVFLMNRLAEWSEDTLLLIHRGFILSLSSAMTALFCTQSMGICRPQPMLFYLKNLTKEIKFQRDPFSLVFVLSLVTSVSVLQILIELKKHKLQNNVRNAQKTAEEASRNLQEARLKMNQEINDTTHEALKSEESKNQSNALKFARAVALFAILPESIFAIFFSLESIQDWRPHGVTAALMLIAGTIVPAVIFIVNAKLKKFATDYFRNILYKLVPNFKSPRVAPIIIDS